MSRAADYGTPHATAGLWRRLLLLGLVLIPSAVASQFMAGVLPYHGATAVELAIVLIFGVLFGWISIGLWTALAGFVVLLRGGRHYGLARSVPQPEPIAQDARTAVLMPVYREEMPRVIAGLRATIESVLATGQGDRFAFFLLSDNPDPDGWVAEEAAWAQLRAALPPQTALYYRRRHHNLKRKSGNLADFCRRWGSRYRYFVVLDADSVMSGAALVRLVNMMERNPGVGLIQTAPRAFGARSPFARALGFASHAYGPLYAAGLHYWQLGDGSYFGHNAIIRAAPFMRHCALSRLPGRPPLGGEILSHDFVEAALLRRAGWTIWLAHDLPGSWEELPPNLLEALRRDRRWCQGNLQHLRLLFADGVFPAHRALFINGVMSYVSALLWLSFLVLCSAHALGQAFGTPDYFPAGPSLFPHWPVWQRRWAVLLAGVTLVILFLPKVLALVIALHQRSARAYGGFARMALSAITESLMSVLLAPTLAVFHSQFVLLTLLGQRVGWGVQSRGDAPLRWRTALRYHGPATLVAGGWAMTMYALDPGFFWWLAPVTGALVVAIPLAVWSSRATLGDALARAGIVRLPPEIAPAAELDACVRYERTFRPRADFVSAVVDPDHNALHVALQGLHRAGKRRAGIAAARLALVQRACTQGPQSLSVRERSLLLREPALLLALHTAVWCAPPANAALWGCPPLPAAAPKPAQQQRSPAPELSLGGTVRP